MPAEISSPTRTPARRYAGWTAAILAAVLIWLGNLFFPTIPTVGLDPSWQLVLNHAAHTDWVFGRDLVYTYGPWGWLTTQYYFADTFAIRFAWELLFKAVGAILIVIAATRLAWPRRIALLAAALLLPPFFQDTWPMLLIAGLTLRAARPTTPRALLIIAGAFLGFLALQKFTFLVMVAGGLACVIAHHAIERRWSAAAWLFASAFGAFLGGWLAAGQPLAALPAFLQHAAWISSDYGDAMFLDESTPVFACGVASAILFLLLVWDSPRWRNLPLAFALTGFGFVAWKLGFVRADGHTLGFFFFALFAGLVAPWLNDAPQRRRTIVSWSLVVVALAGSLAAAPDLPANIGRALRVHLADKTRALLRTDPLYRYVDRAVATLRTENDLPAIRTAVGSATVDQFGHDQLTLLLNGLAYRPRPVFQGFLAYSGRLAALNESAYLSTAAPAFTLARLETIDGRYPPLDDARLLPRLISDHSFVLAENGYLLLRRNPPAGALTRQPIDAGELRFGREHTLPAHQAALWATIDISYSWLGHVRRLLYKPPEVTLVLRYATGTETRHRFVVPAGRDGFLLSPTLFDTADLEQLVAHHRARAPQSFRLETPPDAAKYFDVHIRLELSALAELPFTATASP